MRDCLGGGYGGSIPMVLPYTRRIGRPRTLMLSQSQCPVGVLEHTGVYFGCEFKCRSVFLLLLLFSQ